MNNDLISRSALLGELIAEQAKMCIVNANDISTYTEGVIAGISTSIEKVRNSIVVDAEVVRHGKWIEADRWYDDTIDPPTW